MKAALLKTTDAPITIQDVPMPRAGAGQVVVQLKAAALNHRDVWIQKGGIRLAQKITVSYAYEYPLSVLRPSTGGTHEITLGITLGNRDHYASPRYFW